MAEKGWDREAKARFARDFKRSRLKLELTEKGLGKKLGISGTMVQVYENANIRTMPTPKRWAIIREVMNGFEPMNYISGMEEDSEQPSISQEATQFSGGKINVVDNSHFTATMHTGLSTPEAAQRVGKNTLELTDAEYALITKFREIGSPTKMLASWLERIAIIGDMMR